jgi:hypothetical protein
MSLTQGAARTWVNGFGSGWGTTDSEAARFLGLLPIAPRENGNARAINCKRDPTRDGTGAV